MGFNVEHGATFRNIVGTRYGFGDVSLFEQDPAEAPPDTRSLALLGLKDTLIIVTQKVGSDIYFKGSLEKLPMVQMNGAYAGDGWMASSMTLELVETESQIKMGDVGYCVNRYGRVDRFINMEPEVQEGEKLLEEKFHYTYDEINEHGIWVGYHRIVHYNGEELLSVAHRDGTVKVGFGHGANSDINFHNGDINALALSHLLAAPLDFGASAEVAERMEELWRILYRGSEH